MLRRRKESKVLGHYKSDENHAEDYERGDRAVVVPWPNTTSKRQD